MSAVAPESVGRRLELLKQAVPGVSRVAILSMNLLERTDKDMLKEQKSHLGRWEFAFKP